MAAPHKHPPSPETWAAAMFAVLGLCAAGLLALYFLGAFSGRQLLWLLSLLALAALSVALRYFASPPRPGG